MAVIVNVAGKWDGRDIDKARAQLKKLGDGAETEGRKASSSFSRIGSDLKSLVAVGGAAAGVLWFKGAIESAGELQDTVSAAGQVFGDQQQKIIDFGKNAATSMGLSENSAVKAATSFAVFGKAAGLSGDQAAGFSTTLTQLAGDMASFYGGSVEDAVTAIGSALRGEQEPIRRYNVLLDDATLRQEAMRLGLIKTTTEALTPQQKVLAANSAILKQTTVVQGDYNRTADQFSNTQRTMAAEWQNTTTAIGQGFLPVATDALALGRGTLEVFNGIPAPVKATAGAFAFAAVAARLLDKPLTSVTSTAKGAPGFFRSLGDTWRYTGTQAALAGVQYETTGQKLRAMTTHLRLGSQATGLLKGAGAGLVGMLGGPWGLAIGGATLAVGAYMNAQQNAKTAVDGLTSSLDRQSGAATAETYREIAKALREDITSSKEWEELNRHGLSLDRVTAAVVTGGDALRSLQADIDKASDSSGNASFVAKALGSSVQNQLEVVGDANAQWEANQAATAAAARAQSASAPKVDAVTTKVQTQADKIAILDAAWKRLNGLLSRQEAADAATKAFHALDQALDENGTRFSGTSEKALANRDALRQAIKAVEDHVTALGHGPNAVKAYNDDVATLRATLANAHLSKKEQDALLAPLLAMKNVVVDTRSEWQMLRAALGKPIHGGVSIAVTASGDLVAHGTAIPRRAAGGPVAAGRPYIVGERRPELFVPDRPGYVVDRVPATSAPSVTAPSSGAGGTSVSVSVQIAQVGSRTDVDHLIDRIVHELPKRMRR